MCWLNSWNQFKLPILIIYISACSKVLIVQMLCIITVQPLSKGLRVDFSQLNVSKMVLLYPSCMLSYAWHNEHLLPSLTKNASFLAKWQHKDSKTDTALATKKSLSRWIRSDLVQWNGFLVLHLSTGTSGFLLMIYFNDLPSRVMQSKLGEHSWKRVETGDSSKRN